MSNWILAGEVKRSLEVPCIVHAHHKHGADLLSSLWSRPIGNENKKKITSRCKHCGKQRLNKRFIRLEMKWICEYGLEDTTYLLRNHWTETNHSLFRKNVLQDKPWCFFISQNEHPVAEFLNEAADAPIQFELVATTQEAAINCFPPVKMSNVTTADCRDHVRIRGFIAMPFPGWWVLLEQTTYCPNTILMHLQIGPGDEM